MQIQKLVNFESGVRQNMQNRKPIEILLIEDNPGDARLTIEAMKENQLTIDANITLLDDGEKARDYILFMATNENSVTPDIILLDLNLPKISGNELLRLFKTDLKLKRVPVVILTSSEEIEDVNEAYSEHASRFITKPIDAVKLAKIVKEIDSFQFSIAKLPPKD